MITEDRLNHLLYSAMGYAREAGRILTERTGAHLKVLEKRNHYDLVTEVDQMTEQFIRQKIKDDYWDHWILSEEETGKKNSYQLIAEKTSGYGWIIDPIDGTTNFIHGIPHFAISIGIVYNQEPIVGVVYNPMTQEIYYAKKSCGAYMNGKPIQIGEEEYIKESVIATGFQSSQWKEASAELKNISNFIGRSRSLRIIGAASLDLSWLACGKLTGFWHEGLQPWDTCAAVLIVREAGGVVTDKYGNEYRLEHQSLVASNGKIHSQLLKLINSGGDL